MGILFRKIGGRVVPIIEGKGNVIRPINKLPKKLTDVLEHNVELHKELKTLFKRSGDKQIFKAMKSQGKHLGLLVSIAAGGKKK